MPILWSRQNTSAFTELTDRVSNRELDSMINTETNTKTEEFFSPTSSLTQPLSPSFQITMAMLMIMMMTMPLPGAAVVEH